MIKTITAFIAGAIIVIGGLFATNQTQLLGNFSPTGGGTYRLQSSIGGSATSLTLTSFKEPISNIAYTMSYLDSSIEYATLEPQSSGKEFISFTGITQNADGTATLTGLSRGLGFSYPYTASTTLQQPHSGQSILILSNPPQLYNQYAALSNDQTFAGVNTFTLSPILPTPTTATQGANKSYVDGVALVSAPNADTVTKGVVQLATGLQAASSTLNGTTGARDVLPSSIATDTPSQNSSSGSKVVMSLIGGYISQAWLDLSAAFTFNGLVSIAASTAYPLTLNGIAYIFPSANSIASSTMVNNGSGTLTWADPPIRFLYLNSNVNKATSGSATTSMLSVTIPANTYITTNKMMKIDATFTGGSSDCQYDLTYGTGSATTTIAYAPTNAGQEPIVRMQGTMYSTSVSNQRWTMMDIGFTTSLIENDGGLIYKTTSATTNSLAANTYLNFRGRSASSGTCTLTGAEVELDTF